VETFRQDLRYALRTLGRTRRVAVPAILTLALGIGFALALLMLVERGLSRTASPEPAARAAVWEAGWSDEVRTPALMQAESLDALLWLLGGATVLVLLVVCINLGVLLMARAAARQQELSLRVVLGAARPRLSRQLLTEAGTLFLLGGTLGFILSGGVLAMLHATWPTGLHHWLGGGPSAAASLGALGLPLATALGCGLIPLRAASRTALASTLSSGERATPGPEEGVVRGWLVVLAVTASVALLVSAGLLLRSFVGISGTQAHELGYDPRDTLTFRLDFAAAGAADPVTLWAAQAKLLEQLGGLPGIVRLGFATEGAWAGVSVEDRVRAQCGDCFRGGMWLPITSGLARHHVVGPGFLQTLGVPLLRGRGFTSADDADASRVALINRSFMNQIFTGRDPLGKPIQVGGPEGDWHTVVGVIEDVRARGLGSGGEPAAALYLSALQHPVASPMLAIRFDRDALALRGGLEATLRAAHPALAPTDALLLEDRLAAFQAPLRWFAGIFAALAGLAALVAGIGVAGVVAYSVARRTRELGIRLALGAQPDDVVRLIVRQGARLTGIGAWLGLLAALSLARLLQVLFLAVRPLDPVVYLGVVLLLGGASLLACYLPARQAARVEPLIALRSE
jgi:predicted permease